MRALSLLGIMFCWAAASARLAAAEAAAGAPGSPIGFPELAEALGTPGHVIILEDIWAAGAAVGPTFAGPHLKARSEELSEYRKRTDLTLSGGVLKLHDPRIDANLGFDPLAVKIPELSFKQQRIADIVKKLGEESGAKILLLFETHAMDRIRLDLELKNGTVREGLIQLMRALKCDYLNAGYTIGGNGYLIGVTIQRF